jgi:hypothetical protein
MGENPEVPKALPEPEKKKNCINVMINLDELYENIPSIPTPENQTLWTSVEEMSPEYQKINTLLQILMFFVARTCNESAEVKENVAKRMMLVRQLLGVLIDNLNLTGYAKYGILTEVLQDTYMSISGKRYIKKMLKAQARKEHLSIEKSKPYTS